MEIDRKKPDEPYTIRVIRLLYGPFRWTRNDAIDDTPLAEHFPGVNMTF